MAKSIKPIVKENLRDIIINDMISSIKEGNWKNGEKLPTEMELAKSYNVSRNVMREALKTLEMFGILESKVSKGTFLTDDAYESIMKVEFYNELKDNKSFKKLFELRLAIEPHLSFLAAQRRTDEDVILLKKYVESKKNETEEEYMEFSHFEFHLTVARMADNSVMEKLLKSVIEQLRNTTYVEFNKGIFTDSYHRDHIDIVEAIINQDAELAQELMFKELHEHIKIISEELYDDTRFYK